MLLALAALALACAPRLEWEEGCTPEPPPAGEVRAAEFACEGQGVEGGEAREHDLLLENALVRYLFRQPGRALTLPGLGGGGLIDAAAQGGRDALEEWLPLWHGCWLAEAEASWGTDEEGAWLAVEGELAGSRLLEELGVTCEVSGEHRFTYRLAPDSPVLEVEGADGSWLLPRAGATLRGHLLLLDGAALAVEGEVQEDLGGALLFGPGGLAAGEPARALAALWPGGPSLSARVEGEGVALRREGEELGWLPVEDWGGELEAELPAGTDALRAEAEGWAPGPWEEPGEGLALAVGEAGFLAVRGRCGGEAAGGRLDAWPSGQGGEPALSFPVPPEGAVLPLGPGRWDLRFSAGPACGRAELRELELRAPDASEPERWEPELERAYEPGGWVLADLALESWPSPLQREEPARTLARAAADGVGFAVLVARDEVAALGDLPSPQPWGRWQRARAGSWSRSAGGGAAWSWPWSAAVRRAGHGAVAGEAWGAEELLAAAWGGPGRDRFLAVDAAWVEEAGEPFDWDPEPLLLLLEGPEDLPVLLDLLEHWVPLGVAGPYTWLAVEDPAAFGGVEAERAVVEARTAASSGPFLSLEAWRPEPWDPPLLDLRGAAPAWMGMEEVVVYADGQEVARWDWEGEDWHRSLALPGAERWVLAVALGGEDPGPPARGAPWAVAGPAWLGRPGED